MHCDDGKTKHAPFLKGILLFHVLSPRSTFKIVIICLLWFKNASVHHTNCRQCYALFEDLLEPELDV